MEKILDVIANAFTRPEIMEALEIMGKGMGGIFASLCAIAISVWIMQKVCK